MKEPRKYNLRFFEIQSCDELYTFRVDDISTVSLVKGTDKKYYIDFVMRNSEIISPKYDTFEDAKSTYDSFFNYLNICEKEEKSDKVKRIIKKAKKGD